LPRRSVGFFEIFSFEEEFLATCFGKRIGETVAEVKSRPMPALTKIRIGPTSYMCLLFSHRFNGNAGAAKESIELPAAARSRLSRDNNRPFNNGGGRDPAGVSIAMARA
jgi:hypothetical protein